MDADVISGKRKGIQVKTLKVMVIKMEDVLKNPSDSKIVGRESWTVTALPKETTNWNISPDGRVMVFYTEDEPDKAS